MCIIVYVFICAGPSPRPKSFQLVGLFTTDAWEIVAPWLVSSSCGSFIRKALAVILHPLMLSGLGITATPSREKDVITNSAALQVVRAHLIACLDFSALITGLLVWHLADDSLQPEQQGCSPEWPSWFQPREHLWDRVACMSDARGLLQLCRFCSLRSDKAPVCLWGAASFGLRQQASGAACRQ